MTIQTIPTISELRQALERQRAAGKSVGFVPTMGALHAGHASLMEVASKETDLVVASIFVNPLQFSATEDLGSYPRDLETDTALAEAAGVGLLFAPSTDEMYPEGAVLTSVDVAEISQRWEGASRPTHFSGVATVVAKLLSIVGPCVAYFGEKDFQQLAVIRRMVSDLSIPATIRGCPIVREADGLAMSSRNIYLEQDERIAAVVLRKALDLGIEAATNGESSAKAIGDLMANTISAEPLAKLNYAAAVDTATLEEVEQLVGDVRLLVAAQVGRPHLIDNASVPTMKEGAVS